MVLLSFKFQVWPKESLNFSNYNVGEIAEKYFKGLLTNWFIIMLRMNNCNVNRLGKVFQLRDIKLYYVR